MCLGTFSRRGAVASATIYLCAECASLRSILSYGNEVSYTRTKSLPAAVSQAFYTITKDGTITWQPGTQRGLRGSTLEDLINRTNEKYLESNLALIQKIPTPITPIKIDKEHRHITLAYF